MEKWQKSRFGLFQRSLEEIAKSTTQAKATRDRQARLVDEARASVESVTQNIRVAQRDFDQLRVTYEVSWDKFLWMLMPNHSDCLTKKASMLRSKLIFSLPKTRLSFSRDLLRREELLNMATCFV
jgi:hypothetical protein